MFERCGGRRIIPDTFSLQTEKREVISKAFRVTGICPLQEGEVLHDYDFLEARKKRVRNLKKKR